MSEQLTILNSNTVTNSNSTITSGITWIPWQQPYTGDPLPNWDYGTAPYYPYIEIQPWPYPKSKSDEEIKKILEEFLKQKEEAKKLKSKEENLMKVFEILVIDKKECKVLHQQIVIAKDKETAMLDLDLTLEIRGKVKKNLIEFIFNEKGQFAKVERKLEIKELKEEEE